MGPPHEPLARSQQAAITSAGTLRQWCREARAAGAFSVRTGNQHLVLILETVTGDRWIALLGKRAPHFPFHGTRFENATFFRVRDGLLAHCAEAALPSLRYDCGEIWTVTGLLPFAFRFRFRPAPLPTRAVFLKRCIPSASRHVPGARFHYHALELMEPDSARIDGEPLAGGHGISEQGALSLLTPADWRVPFTYRLLLDVAGGGGALHWRADPAPARNWLERIPQYIKARFLHDRWAWGGVTPSLLDASATVLTATRIGFGATTDLVLHREIVEVVDASGRRYYGLHESFVRG